MDAQRANIYSACDSAIRVMNREILEAFGRLKMAKWEKVNIIRTVVTVYRDTAQVARKRYYEIAYEVYALGLMLCDIDAKQAHKMAEKRITAKWVDDILEQTDFVTLYRFNSEAERKAYRLAETLEVTPDKNRAIEKALKEWSRQLGQYAITFTDEALIQAYADAGVKTIRWITAADERTCHACAEYHNKEFLITEVPPKPHYGCRCILAPVK